MYPSALFLLPSVLSGSQVAHSELSTREIDERFDQFHEMPNITQMLKLRCFFCRERIASDARGACSGLVLEFRFIDEKSAIIAEPGTCCVCCGCCYSAAGRASLRPTKRRWKSGTLKAAITLSRRTAGGRCV